VVAVRSAVLYSPAPTIDCTPGETARFPLELVNRGNCAERFELSCAGVPEGWPAPEFRDGRGEPVSLMVVAPFCETNLSIWVRLPASTGLENATISVAATGGVGFRAEAALTVVVEKPALAIISVAPSVRDPRAGELVYVNVTVRNDGRATALSATLDCYRNGEAIITRDLGALEPGASRVESFVWIPRAGRNILVFMVGPEDALSATNASGRTAVLAQYVSAPPGAASADNGWLMVGAAAGVAGTAAAALVVYLRRKKKKS
jgi:hypothetical protein